MCGRFTLRTPASILVSQFDLDETPSLEPRFNIAPGRPILVVRERSEARGRVLEPRRWGLVPAWAKDPRIGSRLINARSETVAEKPAFRRAFESRRCLVPADGFYEWQGPGDAPRSGRSAQLRRPFFIQRVDEGLFAIAGLWERWHGSGGEPIDSCTLLTTDANDALRAIHGRMPLILDPADYGLWLDPAIRDRERLLALARPYPSQDLALRAVGFRVNRPDRDDPDCIAPATDHPQAELPF